MRLTENERALFDTTDRYYLHHSWEIQPTLTVKRASEICESAKQCGLFGISKINRSLTKQQAYDILSKGFGSTNPEDKIHFLAARNIIKEFGSSYTLTDVWDK